MTREERDDAIKFFEEVAKKEVDNAKYSKLAIEALEQEPILDKIRAEIIKYEADCSLSVDEYPSCKQCTDNVFETIYGILDKYKTENEVEDKVSQGKSRI